MSTNYLTLASTNGSASMILNPTAKATTVQLQLAAASTGAVTLNLTLQDPSALGSPTAIWTLLSSGAAMTTSAVFANGGLVYTVLSPIGGLQVVSTNNNGTIYLSALQSVTG